MSFHAIHKQWLDKHLMERKGDSKRRLEQGHGHAEKLFLENVWLPAFHELDGLVPEYEIADFRDGIRYLDFAYIKNGVQLAVEIDGFRSHATETSRWQFSDSLMRQNHLVLDGWKLLRFSYDYIKEKPRMCQQLLQQFMGRSLIGRKQETSAERFLQLEVIRYAIHSQLHIRPSDVIRLLKIDKRNAQKLLHSMVNKQLLLPAGKGTQRVRCYKLNPQQLELISHEL
ncbi:DNA-binding response regulator [Paenibacillus sinopodophylli]|uniref:DNA-binding response regulator n=1 Tax=Paenibacillus sinopodophylli TaxID=1837342 RepID=UPI001FEA73B0|nr:DNA-binding response regulator [Paenibacillus sinopodophylli]